MYFFITLPPLRLHVVFWREVSSFCYHRLLTSLFDFPYILVEISGQIECADFETKKTYTVKSISRLLRSYGNLAVFRFVFRQKHLIFVCFGDRCITRHFLRCIVKRMGESRKKGIFAPVKLIPFVVEE